jgi:hypothetical protein
MYFRVCLFVVLMLGAQTLFAADSPQFTPAQQAVLDVHRAMGEASHRREMAAFSRFIVDDCIFSDDDGVLVTKAQLVGHIGKMSPEYDHSVNYRDYVVHLYGNTAVINYRVTVHEQFTDADIVSEQRRTETYIKRNGSWLLVGRQWGNVPVSFRKPVAVDTHVYEDYVGQFEWRPRDPVDSVSVHAGRLWSHLGGSTSEYLPLGHDTFFFKDDLGIVEFSRDAQSHVIGYTYHRGDGQDIHVKKIK